LRIITIASDASSQAAASENRDHRTPGPNHLCIFRCRLHDGFRRTVSGERHPLNGRDVKDRRRSHSQQRSRKACAKNTLHDVTLFPV
jgi:hypothetical protein